MFSTHPNEAYQRVKCSYFILVKGTEHEGFHERRATLESTDNIQCYKYSIFVCLETLIVRRHRFHDGNERKRGRAVVLEHEIS